MEKFDGEFVAVYGQKVVDHDKEINALINRVREKYPAKHVLVERALCLKVEPLIPKYALEGNLMHSSCF